MSLSFCAAGAGVGGGFEAAAYTGEQLRFTGLSQTIDSDQIKYLNIQSLYFLLCLPVILFIFSSYMFAALYGWALGNAC